MCLCWLLKSQDRKVWQLEITQNAYMLILSFIDHQKPKVILLMIIILLLLTKIAIKIFLFLDKKMWSRSSSFNIK
jgi:hypothetical protein